MKPISTAMALGSLLLRPVAGVFYDTQGGGCAWGMVHAAAPHGYDSFVVRALNQPCRLPCGCTGTIYGGAMSLVPAEWCNNLANAIVHLFDEHVATKKDWTMERLIDWVRENEPDVEEPQEAFECSNETRALAVHS